MSGICRMCREGNHPACSGIMCSCTVTARCRANAALVDERKIIGAIALCVLAPLIILLALIVPRAQRVDSVSESAAARVVAIPPVATTQARLTQGPRDNGRVRAMSADSESPDWYALADCESGAWDRHGVPIPGSAHWNDTRGPYEGGIHFSPGTYLAHRLPGFPAHAYDATPAQQIAVGERVLASQGPGAWPVCSYKAGFR